MPNSPLRVSRRDVTTAFTQLAQRHHGGQPIEPPPVDHSLRSHWPDPSNPFKYPIGPVDKLGKYRWRSRQLLNLAKPFNRSGRSHTVGG